MSYSTESEAIRAAIQAHRTGMLSNDPRVVYKDGAGMFRVVCSGFEPSNCVVLAFVARGKVC